MIGNYTIRDEKSLKKLASGLIKLLIPNASTSGINRQELKQILDICIEYRNQIREWLHILQPGEFPEEKISYKMK